MSPAYRTLFDRLSLVFHRTSYTAGSTTTSFTSSLLARFGKRRFPDYVVSRTFAIFPSRPLLKQYEKALEVERRIEEILGEVGWEKLPAGAPRRIKTAEEKKAEKDAMCRDGIALFLSIEKSWEVLCKGAEKEMKLEEDDEEKRLLYYRRRFHPGQRSSHWDDLSVNTDCGKILRQAGHLRASYPKPRASMPSLYVERHHPFRGGRT